MTQRRLFRLSDLIDPVSSGSQRDIMANVNITIHLPADVSDRLQEISRRSGQSLEACIIEILSDKNLNGASQSAPDALDAEFEQLCAGEADESVSFQAVRDALSKIPGSMTDDFIAARDER